MVRSWLLFNRARNLLKDSEDNYLRKILNSKVPQIRMIRSNITYQELENIPAKAILGIAYNKPVMPLDANIERILARYVWFSITINLKLKAS